MKRIFQVKRYTAFPKQVNGKDIVMKTFKNMKQAQEYSIRFNELYKSRYYVYIKYEPIHENI